MSLVPLIQFKQKQAEPSAPAARTPWGSSYQLPPDSFEQRNTSPSPLVRVLIVGAGAVGLAIAEQLEASPRHEVVGFADDEIDPLGSKSWPLLGPRAAASDIAKKWGIDEIVLAYAPTWQQELMEDLTRHNPGSRVRVVPSFYDTLLCTGKIRSIGEMAVIDIAGGAEQLFDYAKRGFDLCVAIVGLLLLLPLMVLLAAVICLTSRGPALFKQERVGRHNKPFTLYKFRTMRLDAEKPTGPVLSKGKKDERLTPIGYYLRLVRLDELPQLLNVLKGEMSLVGPRPERPCFVAVFETRNPVYARRHQVRPGITGLAQVNGGYHTDARDKLRFDLFYIAHRSPWLDLSIMAQTVLAVTVRPTGR